MQVATCSRYSQKFPLYARQDMSQVQIQDSTRLWVLLNGFGTTSYIYHTDHVEADPSFEALSIPKTYAYFSIILHKPHPSRYPLDRCVDSPSYFCRVDLAVKLVPKLKMACLGQLIPELVLQITDHLKTHDVFSLSLTCSRFSTLLSPTLLKLAVTHVNPRSGQTPLHWATNRNHKFSFAKDLLAHGAAASPRDKNGITPLHIAARVGHIGMARQLLSHGAEVNVTCNETGSTPLHLVTSPKTTVLLIDHGADLTVTNRDGEYPVQSACRCGRTRVVRELLDKGAVSYVR